MPADYMSPADFLSGAGISQGEPGVPATAPGAGVPAGAPPVVGGYPEDAQLAALKAAQPAYPWIPRIEYLLSQAHALQASDPQQAAGILADARSLLAQAGFERTQSVKKRVLVVVAIIVGIAAIVLLQSGKWSPFPGGWWKRGDEPTKRKRKPRREPKPEPEADEDDEEPDEE